MSHSVSKLGYRGYRSAYQLSWLEDGQKTFQLGAGDYGRCIQSAGRDRFFEIHVPPGYQPDKPMPLVLNFHGGGGNPEQARFDSQMDKYADRHGFIAVYPSGTSRFFQDKLLTFNAGICCGYAKLVQIDDVAFTHQLLDDIAKYFSIDAKRVYATGLSNGALMSYRLAIELSDRIAAIAPVAGQLPVNYFAAPPARTVSIIHFHGVNDTHASYTGGIGRHSINKLHLPPVSEALATWAVHNGCSPKPIKETHMGNAVCSDFGSGKDDAEVLLWTLADGGHTWPGGPTPHHGDLLPLGKVNRDISATELMWQFFLRHSMK